MNPEVVRILRMATGLDQAGGETILFTDERKADILLILPDAVRQIAAVVMSGGGIMIREITEKDYYGLMTLYMQLHDNPMPEETADLMTLWKQILHDKDHHIIVAETDGKIVSSCVCVIIPNLTHNQQPYAFVENVITDKEYRCRGFATACLNYAREIALKENCYKLMLLTGSKKENVLNFYRKAGYNSEDKTAFIQWI